MDQRLMDSEDVAGKRRRVVIDDGLPHRGPGVVSHEHVHARPSRHHVPAGPLEDPEKGGLIQVTERVAVIGIDDVLDVGE